MSAPAKQRVFLTWTIHHSCNYRCPYCFITTGHKDISCKTLPGPGQAHSGVGPHLPPYGSCIIKFAGGEPFTYPTSWNCSATLDSGTF